MHIFFFYRKDDEMLLTEKTTDIYSPRDVCVCVCVLPYYFPLNVIMMLLQKVLWLKGKVFWL